MGKMKWNKDKPKRSGVFRVRETIDGQKTGEESQEVTGYAWFDATRRRWAGTRQSPQDARDSQDTAQARFMANQDKEWARV